jgi:putative phosphoribosyl transferase
MVTPIFRNRSEAGKQLALSLVRLKDSDPVVMGVPRGGVLVAVEVVRAVRGLLDLMIVRRITAPGQPDAMVGAVLDGSRPEIICDEAVMAEHGMPREAFDAEVARLRYAIAFQQNLYAAGRPRCDVQNRVVVLAEDTIITGATARVAARALYKERARRVVIAAPVAVAAAAEALKDECDELVVLAGAASPDAARWSYADFRPVTDSDVVRCMREVPAPFF